MLWATVCVFNLCLSILCELQYRFYGEPVVKACVENGAHCLDISGEPQVTNRSYIFIIIFRFWISKVV